MDENSREVRFTDIDYLSPKGVAEAVGFSSIDFIWESIRSYRDTRKHLLPLFTTARTQFFYTALEKIMAKIEAAESRLGDFLRQFKTVSAFEETKKEAIRLSHLHNLLNAGKLFESNVNELSVKAMLNGMFAEEDPKKKAIYGYMKILDSLSASADELDEESFLADSLSKILGTEELMRFYRDTDGRSIMTDSHSTVPPAKMIPALMKSLWNFLATSRETPYLNGLIAMYWMVYVQPFERAESLLLAAALGKFVLAKSGFGQAAAYLPLEEALLFSPHFARYEDAEIRKSGDLTYFLLFAGSALSEGLRESLDAFQSIQSSAIKAEVREIPKDEIPGMEEEVPEEPKEEAAEKKARKRVSDDVEEASDYELPEDDGSLSFKAPKGGLKSDKEVKEMARYLLETHPRLRKGQASFYASHCTLGRYYTIQDFKKSVRCAYETARTSMDLLAEENLYKKLKIKNKYVYTPIKQGE